MLWSRRLVGVAMEMETGQMTFEYIGQTLELKKCAQILKSVVQNIYSEVYQPE